MPTDKLSKTMNVINGSKNPKPDTNEKSKKRDQLKVWLCEICSV
jgi:hypothetical protein